MNKSHLTARTREKPSVPIRILDKKDLLIGNLLDYGCGKGFDAKHFNMDKYDPHYAPQKPTGKYNTITCIYVLNVIEDKRERLEVIEKIKNLLDEGGKAYISVRRDIVKNNGKEGKTSKGTYQKNITLSLPVFKKTSTYCTYILSRT